MVRRRISKRVELLTGLYDLQNSLELINGESEPACVASRRHKIDIGNAGFITETVRGLHGTSFENFLKCLQALDNPVLIPRHRFLLGPALLVRQEIPDPMIVDGMNLTGDELGE